MTQIEFTHKLISLHDNLQYYANMLTSNREEAKDLIQDTYLKALANRQGLPMIQIRKPGPIPQ
ncbi:MAG: hypothetical protein IPH45_20170 [Bacteroidales bacterium]|nr:hypothetical protein [Bacteroidales bacterium]